MLCYCDFMLTRRLLLLLCLLAPLLLARQPKSGIPEPSLPVVDDNACPFEGCSFGKWIVTRDFKLFSSWKEGRKPLTAVRKGQVVDALTGVHITYEPDRIQVFRPIADLQLNPGDVILRYMYRGEGFADIWANGQFHKEYDCSFITEKNNSGCSRDCNAKVVSEGRKEWWAHVKTAPGVDGWAKVDDQFDCMDALGRSPNCENLAAPHKTDANPPSR